MSTAESKAKAKEYAWRAAQSRKQAKQTVEAAAESIGDFTMQGEQLLSQGVVLLGKTGSLSEKRAQDPGYVAVGSKTVEGLDKTAAEKEKEVAGYAELEGFVNISVVPERAAEELGVLQGAQALGESKQITGSEGMLYATGSDLATLASTRSLLERDRRRMIRAGQQTALSMLEAGEMYDEQASYAADAGAWDVFATTLDLILGGLKFGLEYF